MNDITWEIIEVAGNSDGSCTGCVFIKSFQICERVLCKEYERHDNENVMFVVKENAEN
jgi:hypothetical protein